jgi:hypothetical protein
VKSHAQHQAFGNAQTLAVTAVVFVSPTLQASVLAPAQQALLAQPAWGLRTQVLPAQPIARSEFFSCWWVCCVLALEVHQVGQWR